MTAARLPVRVVKVGGSLLDWRQLPDVLKPWLAEQSPAQNVLVCGGGPLTDAIRRADRVHSLGEETAHWLCIDALAVSARLLAALLHDLPVVDTLNAACTLALGRAVILDPRRFLTEAEPQSPGCVLPHNWSATTDSIAARIAEVCGAEELVLLKSAGPPPHQTIADLAAAEYVDRHFPAAAAGLAVVRYVNLRKG